MSLPGPINDPLYVPPFTSEAMALLTYMERNNLGPAMTINNPGVTRQLVNGKGILRGWSLRDNNNVGGSALVIVDGDTSSGQNLGEVIHAQNTGETVWLSDGGVVFQSGLSVVVITSVMVGCFYVIPETDLRSDEPTDAFGRPLRIYPGFQ